MLEHIRERWTGWGARISFGAVLLIFGSWMLQTLLGFTNEVFSYIKAIGH